MTAYAFDVRRANGARRRAGRRVQTSHRQLLEEGANLLTGLPDFEEEFGNATTLEQDLLTLAATVFAADRASPRGERELLARSFSIDIPVANLERLHPLAPQLERVLRALSQDSWRITFSPAAGGPEEDDHALAEDLGVGVGGKTLLFSGGLDSLAAAVEFGRSRDVLQLVSHKTHNSSTSRTQLALAEALISKGYALEHRQFFVSSRDGGATGLRHAEENTQRTRSFVFLVLGALAARRTGKRELLYLAENGQMAIHLPLTQGRIGAFSTHTAHPTVLALMQGFLSDALGVPLLISNPYVHKTKREVTEVVHSNEPALVPVSNSCWMNARLPAGSSHCGICVPCYVRRIAIEALGTDLTSYNRNIWDEDISRLPENDDGRRNLVDLAEFVCRFRDHSDEELMSEFPDLYAAHLDAPNVIAMYRRFSAEAYSVLARYPGVAPLLH